MLMKMVCRQISGYGVTTEIVNDIKMRVLLVRILKMSANLVISEWEAESCLPATLPIYSNDVAKTSCLRIGTHANE